MIPVLLDFRPDYLCDDPAGGSLLLMPIGGATLLDHVLGIVHREAGQPIVVVPTFSADPAYRKRIAQASTQKMRIVEASELPDWTATLESQDMVCVIDPLRQPLAVFDLALTWKQHAFFRGATHLVSVGADDDSVMEDLERDTAGKIRRVRRSYTRVTLPEVANRATFASFVQASAIQNLTFGSTQQLRAALSFRGVLSSDVPLAAETADLTKETGLLELNDWVLASTHPRHAAPSSRGGSPKRSWDRSATIHSTARLVGPVMIQAGCVVEENVTIIGPSVIGSHARLGAGSTVVQSIVASAVMLQPGAEVFHRVVAGDGRQESGGEEWDVRTPRLPSRVRMQAQFDGPAARPASGQWGVWGKRLGAVVKRAVDIVSAGAGLVLLSPVFLLVSILIKLDSRGPVFFSHRREGVGGKDFPCVKFRTMVPDAHQKQRELYVNNEVDGPQFKLAHDPRITRLGRFLRTSNLDELPQLFNVLVGHMSLIGPRPSPFRENQICVPWRLARLSVRPGITGLWQICRDHREGGDFHQWIYFDLLYVRHWSLWLDAKILAFTLLTLGGRWNVPLAWLIVAEDVDRADQDDFGCDLDGGSPNMAFFGTSVA